MKNTKLTIAISAFAAGALLALPLATPIAQAEEEKIDLTIVSWGGAYAISQQYAYFEPYMLRNPHVTIITDDSSHEAVARMREMKKAGDTSWDLVDVLASDSTRLCDEGLVRKIDFDNELEEGVNRAKPTEDFGELLINDCLIPTNVYSTTFGYRTDVAAWDGDEPSSIEDVFDLKKFPGKRSLEKSPTNNLEWALIADGVPAEEVYEVLSTEEGIQRAFAKLDTIKDEVIWWTTGADTPQRLTDGDVVIGSSYNGRLFSVIEEERQPVAMLWDWQVFDFDGWVVPAGLPPKREKAVMHFLRFATDTQRLADQARYISYGPARNSSTPLVGKHANLGIEMAPHMPNNPANAKNTLLLNYKWWASNRDKLDRRFEKWLAE